MQGIKMPMFHAIAQNMSRFFHMYAGMGSVIGASVFVLSFTLAFWNAKKRGISVWRQKRAVARAFIAALLAMYLYIVIGITLLSRSEGYSATVNLRLFSTFGASFSDRMFAYENILLFVPLGILLFALAEPFRKPHISLLAGLCASLSIETAQLFTHLGRFEADDLLTNTCGMLLGYCACKAPALLCGYIAVRHNE